MRYPKARLLVAAIISLLVPACSYGPRVEDFPPARQPAGVVSTLYLGDEILQAEVLAVEEDALLVLGDQSSPHRLAGKLARIPLSILRRGQFAHAGGFRYNIFSYLVAYGSEDMEPYEATGADLAASPLDRDNLRLLSRYPQGVSEELLARLEAAYGEIEALGSGRGG